jgi:hypothetical protein
MKCKVKIKKIISFVIIAIFTLAIFPITTLAATITITTTSSSNYMTSPATAIYPVFVDGMSYKAWTLSGSTSYFQLKASGGSGTYKSWTKVSGTLPPGLSLASNGQISGTPTTVGSYTFTAKVTDSLNRTAQKKSYNNFQ